jgi:hypothetical protein
MRRRINHNKPTKLEYMPGKMALQTAIKVAKGFSNSVDSKYFPNMRGYQ